MIGWPRSRSQRRWRSPALLLPSRAARQLAALGRRGRRPQPSIPPATRRRPDGRSARRRQPTATGIATPAAAPAARRELVARLHLLARAAEGLGAHRPAERRDLRRRRADGGADATLWITRDPKLDFPTFVTQSLAAARGARRLGAISSSASRHRREAGTIVRLAADAPAGRADLRGHPARQPAPTAITWRPRVQPDASREAVRGSRADRRIVHPGGEGLSRARTQSRPLARRWPLSWRRCRRSRSRARTARARSRPVRRRSRSRPRSTPAACSTPASSARSTSPSTRCRTRPATPPRSPAPTAR